MFNIGEIQLTFCLVLYLYNYCYCLKTSRENKVFPDCETALDLLLEYQTAIRNV